MVGEDLTENKDKGSKRVSPVDIPEGRVCSAEETGSAMALREESA